MAREIKFRTWDKQKEKMNDIGVHIFFTDNGELVFRDASYHYIDDYPSYENEKLNERFELMQFTGLKDKKGNEIYEGDVLQTHSGIGYMVFDNCGYAIKSPGSEAIDYEFSAFYLECEIIGNIYQNSELLK